jgi:hypothetical protein
MMPRYAGKWVGYTREWVGVGLGAITPRVGVGLEVY